MGNTSKISNYSILENKMKEFNRQYNLVYCNYDIVSGEQMKSAFFINIPLSYHTGSRGKYVLFSARHFFIGHSKQLKNIQNCNVELNWYSI